MLVLCGKEPDGVQQPCFPINPTQQSLKLLSRKTQSDPAIEGMALLPCSPRTNTICIYTLYHKMLKYKLMVDITRIKGYECV